MTLGHLTLLLGMMTPKANPQTWEAVAGTNASVPKA